MPLDSKEDQLLLFYREICLAFAGCLRALSMYPKDHPESEKRLQALSQRLDKYLLQRPSLTLFFVSGDVAVENTPLPDLSGLLGQLVQRFEAIRLQRIIFRRGTGKEELLQFLQVLLPLLKKKSGADLVLAKSQERFPHILAGALPFEAGSQISYEEVSSALQAARRSVLSFSGQLKDLFSDVTGPLSPDRLALARETTDTIQKTTMSGEISLMILLYRRSSDPDPYVHAVNVSALSMFLARHLGLGEENVREIGLGALLHDIGLHVAADVSLSKTARISLDEKKRQWEHPVRGAEILLSTPQIPDVAPLMAYEHHLHYDGGGYPEQKLPRELNMAGMLLAITDSYDNLRRNRSEQNALSLTDALNWMDQRFGIEFHPLLLKQFRAMVKAEGQEGV